MVVNVRTANQNHAGPRMYRTDGRMFFPSGATVTVGHLNNEAWRRYRSIEAQFIGIDRFEELDDPAAFDLMRSKCRRGRTATLPLRIRATTTDWRLVAFADPARIVRSASGR